MNKVSTKERGRESKTYHEHLRYDGFNFNFNQNILSASIRECKIYVSNETREDKLEPILQFIPI